LAAFLSLLLAGWGAPPTFSTPSTIDLNFSASPGVLTGSVPGLNGGKRLDFGGDGTIEIAANQNSAINFYPGTAGSLVPPANISSYAIADFNADTKPDFAIVAGGDLLVYLNTSIGGTQNFGAPATFTGSGFTQVAAGDIDGDGDIDLVAGSPFVTAGPQLIPFLNGGSAGSYAFTPGTARDLTLGGVSTVAIGDLTGDAAGEVVVAYERTAERYTFTAGALVQLTGQTTFGWTSTRLFVADVTGDGKNDVVSFGHDSTQTNGAPVEWLNSTGVDIARNDSGENDGVGGTYPSGSIEVVAFGASLTQFSGEPAAVTYPVDGALADLNGDSKLEVIGTRQNATGTSGQLVIQQFKESPGIPILTTSDYLAPANTVQFADAYPRRVAVSDLDNDDKLDLVIALMNDDTFQPSLVRANNTTNGGGGGGGPLQITIAGPSSGAVGETLNYTIALLNNSGVSYPNVRLHAWLPGGTTRVLATPPRGVLNDTGGRSGFDWAITKLDPGIETARVLALKADGPTTFAPGDLVARVYARDAAGAVLAQADLPAAVITAGGSFLYGSEFMKVSPGGKANATFGAQFVSWKFEVDHPAEATAPGLAVKLQYADYLTTNWTDLPGGTLTRAKANAPKWTADFPMPLPGGLYQFRTVSTATGKEPSPGPATTGFFVDGLAKLEVTVVTEATDDPNGLFVRPGNDITYRITAKNIGSVAAQNVVVYGPVPGGTIFGAAATANGGTILPVEIRNTKGETLAVAWNVTQLLPNESVTVNYTVETEDDAKVGAKIGGQGWAAGFDVLPVSDQKTFTAAVAKAAKQKTFGVGAVTPALVVKGLELAIQADTGIAPVGSVITYTATAQNLYRSARPECVVTIRIPEGMAFESFGAANGSNFNGTPVTTISTVTNPSLVRPDFLTPGVLTWNLGTIPARETRQLVFKLRVGADLPDTVGNPAGGTSPNEVAIIEYNFRTGGGRTPFYLFDRPTLKDTAPVEVGFLTQPKIRSLLTVPALAGLPQLGISKEVIGQNDGFLAVDGFEVPTVTIDGGFVTEITVTNRGGVAARNCRVVEALAPQVVFDTNVTVDNAPIAHGQFRPFDAKNVEITPAVVTADSRRFFQAALVMFQLGDLAAGQTKVIRYRTRAATLASRDISKPAKDPIISTMKIGLRIPGLVPSLFSDSFSLPILARNTDPGVIVVSPVSLAAEIFPSQPGAFAGDAFSFDTVIRNNGGASAAGIQFAGDVPPGAVFTSAEFIDSLTGTQTGTPTVTRTPASGDAKRIAFAVPTINGNSSLVVRVNFTLKPANQLPASFNKPGSNVVFESEVIYRGASPAPRERTRSETATALPGAATKPALSSSFLNYFGDPNRPRLFVVRQSPLSVREGDPLIYTITVGNHGGSAISNASVAMLIPPTSDLVTTGAAVTTSGYKRSGTKITWALGNIPARGVVTRALVVRPKVGVARKDNLLVENSCVAVGANVPDIAPGPTSTLILNTNPIAGAWQSFSAWLSGFGARGVAASSNALAQRVALHTTNTLVTSVGGADLLANDGGSVIVPLGGGNVLAIGPANVVAAGGGNIVAGGAGNFIATSAGNIVAAGAGNAIAVNGTTLTAANISQLAQDMRANVIGGAVVAAGGGNLIANDGASLIANDGAGLAGSIGFATSNVIAAGGGNVIAAGGGNVVAAGGGNVVAAGGGNVVASGGGNLKPNPASGAQALHLGANGGNVVAAGGGNIVAGGAGNFISGAGGSVVASGGGNIVAGGAGN